MKIQQLPGLPPQRAIQNTPPTPGAVKDLSDQVDLNSAPRKALGACGALAGLCLGRLAPSAGGAVGGWMLGQAASGYLLGGSLGMVAGLAGAAAGIYAGYQLEKRTRLGRLAGGLVGGAVGSAAGAVAGALGWQPGRELAVESRGFSVSSLPKKLLNPNYTSHHRLTPEEAAPGLALVQPGDVIITSDDEDFQLELMQKAIGVSADWTHAALIDEDKNALDIYITTNKPVKNPAAFIFGDNHHVSILRPRYASPETMKKSLDFMRAQFDKITYDHKFDLKTDDSMYCQEYLYKAFQHGSPEIDVPVRKVPIIGREMITSDEFRDCKDMDLVWSTGSDFKYNFLSKVT